MDMDQAAVFFAGSVLTMLGFVVIVVGVVVINNIIYKFWKPVKFTILDPFKVHHNTRFIDESELQSKTDIKTTANNKGELK